MSITARQPVTMSREGYARLQAELEQLTTVKRREVAEWLRDAKGGGGEPGENADVAAALEEQAALERRIDELEATLALASIAEPVDGVAGVGQRLRIRLAPGDAPVDYRLVGPAEADPGRRLISVESPVGQALLGRGAGDVVDVETPRGRRTIEILAIGEDDG